MGECLVHCVAGRSRPTSVIVAILVRYCGYSLEDSKLLVRSNRPEALKQDGHRRAMGVTAVVEREQHSV